MEKKNGVQVVQNQVSHSEPWSKYIQKDETQKLLNTICLDRKQSTALQSEMLSYVRNKATLSRCDKNTVLAAFLQSAVLNLTMTLGESWIVPYKDQAQWQISATGLIQLALRSGFYLHIDAHAIHENEIVELDPYNNIFKFRYLSEDRGAFAGAFATLELKNGFKHSLWRSAQEIEEHAVRYSSAYNRDPKNSLWTQLREKMAEKTVLKLLLTRYGIKTRELGAALISDQASLQITKDAAIEVKSYIDNPQTKEKEEKKQEPPEEKKRPAPEEAKQDEAIPEKEASYPNKTEDEPEDEKLPF